MSVSSNCAVRHLCRGAELVDDHADLVAGDLPAVCERRRVDEPARRDGGDAGQLLGRDHSGMPELR
jgi:hypothetical protein